MSENIVSKIRKAEEDAQSFVDKAKHESQAGIVQARKNLETTHQKLETESREHLKEFQKSQTEKYNAETKRLKDDGKKAEAAYTQELESRFGEIKGKIEEMIRKELCL